MKQWLPLLLRNFLQVSLAYTHSTIRKPYNEEALTISLSHKFAKQKIQIIFTEGKFLHCGSRSSQLDYCK